MKPIHEQEWEHGGHGIVWNKGRIADLVHRPTEGHSQDTEEVLDRGDLISAAPDMARALLRTLGACANTGSRTRGCDAAGIVHACQSCEALSALRKAGVIPTQLPATQDDNQP